MINAKEAMFDELFGSGSQYLEGYNECFKSTRSNAANANIFFEKLYEKYKNDKKINEFCNEIIGFFYHTGSEGLWNWHIDSEERYNKSLYIPELSMSVLSSFSKEIHSNYYLIHNLNGIMFEGYEDEFIVQIMLLNGDYQYINKFIDSIEMYFEKDYFSHEKEQDKQAEDFFKKNQYKPLRIAYNPYTWITGPAIYRKQFKLIDKIFSSYKLKPSNCRDSFYKNLSNDIIYAKSDKKYINNLNKDQLSEFKNLYNKYKDVISKQKLFPFVEKFIAKHE